MSVSIRQIALNFLARREHSRAELERKLLVKGFLKAEIEPVLQKLASERLQSDSRFTESYINMRVTRGFGPLKIRAELGERGIDSNLIDGFFADYKSKWLELAKNIRAKKFGKVIPKDWSECTKQMRYLYYKGFDADLIKQIFNDS